MMGERIKFRNGEQSQVALFCNEKEEMLLNKKLKILESLRKQAENALTLDQRIVYKRFTIKLRRSELAHARLLGNKDIVKRLSQSLFPDLHSVVTDGSEKAVRVILQNAETSRVLSAPSRIQSHLASVSVAKKSICESSQGKEAEIKDAQECFGQGEEQRTQIREQRRNTPGAKNALTGEEETDFSKSALFLEHRRPYTANYGKQYSRSNMNDRYRERLVKKPSRLQDQALDAALPVNLFLPEDKDLEPNSMNGRDKKSHKQRPKSRNLFLGLNNTLLRRHSSMNDYTMLKNDGLLNNKVKLFLQKITDLQREQSCPLQDYYSERLQEKSGKKFQVNQDCLSYTEEQSKWNPVGSEANHRSITIKKLDRNFIRKDSPFEILTWEYYNEIVTKENLTERKWPNNNPYQVIKN
uniref:Uncharacterized protein n=1 Tax=Sphaerodactylus townsendi TaxID=933632 RepID=A0ACB8FIC2_9SAUR